MRKEDLTPIWIYANSLWSTFKLPDTDERYDIMTEVWYDLLKQYELPVIKAGMLELAKTSDFCNVAKIAEECNKIQNVALGKNQTEDTIVNEIRRAASNGFYGAEQEFEKLSPIAKRIVGTPATLRDWACMEADTFNSVVLSNVKRSARNQMEIQHRMEVIKNNNLLGLIQQSADRLALDNKLDELHGSDEPF